MVGGTSDQGGCVPGMAPSSHAERRFARRFSSAQISRSPQISLCPLILRVLEVLEVVDGQQLIGWHYIHRAPGAFNPKLPLAQRRLTPEWAHLRTQQRERVRSGGRKTNMRKLSVSIHSVNSCWLQQVSISICSLMEKFRLRSVLGPTRGFDEWHPRRRAPFWVSQSRLK